MGAVTNKIEKIEQISDEKEEEEKQEEKEKVKDVREKKLAYDSDTALATSLTNISKARAILGSCVAIGEDDSMSRVST